MSQVNRVELNYTNDSDRFLLGKTDLTSAFQRQYFHVYTARLDLMKPRVLEAAKAEGCHNLYKQLEGLTINEKALVIGTIQKKISLRPSVLKELAEDEKMLPEDAEIDDVNTPSLISNKDFVEFEDEKQIVRLEGNINMNEVATGCTVGLYGFQINDNTFHVEKIIWPSVAVQKQPSLKTGAKIALVSGLELTGNADKDRDTCLSLLMFARWLNSEISSDKKESQLVSSIERVIVAGESIASAQAKEFSSAVAYLRLSRQDCQPNINAISTLDNLLSKFTMKLCVDVVPGHSDPSTQMWPQQPIHKACLPLASTNGATLGLVSNPYLFTLGELDFAVTSGHNVTDLKRLSTVQSSSELMKSILRWQHIAPTAPDTIDSFPFDGRDPFILQRLPHVMICGNQPEATRDVYECSQGKTVCISLPKFSKSHIVTLLDLDTLETSTRYFGPN